ncbi:hypothetical protein IRB23M11_01850 [Alkalibacterium sp. m-11]|uniref:Siphovirus-type tail component RIFT-related domain-containing protein n=1 Tax=Alkalibacterium indicireducens TaxID=398758 RepID=A0ABN1B9R6_9LACT
MGFVYNGINSRDMKIKARLTSWQASPALRNSYEIVPGKAGVADFGCDSAERIIVVNCNVFPQKSFADLVGALDDLAEWLNPMNGLKQIVLEDIPNRYFNARLSEQVDCERILRTAGSFDLKFICPDPHAYALADEIFTISNEGSHEVERVTGNADSEPVYQLRGVISSSASTYISISTNGEELRVVGALSADEVLVIDSGLVTAKITDLNGNTLRNGLPGLDELNFPVLHKGDNEITVSVVGATFSELRVLAKSRWR